MATSKISPFRPGTATKPLHVAGRQEELDLIDETLVAITQRLRKGKLEESAMSPIKIVGPRGVGKTTLLTCAGEIAQEKKIHVIRCAHMKDIEPGDAYRTLIDRMLGDDTIEKTVSADLREYAEADPDTHGQRHVMYVTILRALLRERPVLFLLDEAVHYDEKLLAMVLHENQQLISEKFPLAMIIAGTPALDCHLYKVNGTFVSGTEDIYINQLSDEAVRDALREPFKKRRVKVDKKALDLMASWTSNYPYFIQIAGDTVWEAMQEAGSSEVDLHLAQEAEPEMLKARNHYHCKVHENIDQAELLEQAEQMVDIIESADKELLLEDARQMLGEAAKLNNSQAREVFNKLLDLDLIWLLEDDMVVPALPSFFDYIKERRN